MNPSFVRCYFYYAKAARGGKRIVEKTNYYIHHLDRLSATFPRGRFLVIHRHPVDTYTSYLRRGKVEDRPWLKKTPDEFCDLWRRNMQAIRSNAHRVLAIPYDELTADPERVFRGVCEYIDAPFDRSALSEPNPDLERLPADPHLYAPITAQTKDWRQYVNETDAGRIEENLRDLMEHFGYEAHVKGVR